MTSKDLAKKIATIASEMKADQIKILDLQKLSSFTDFFVICSGTSDRQLQAIADKVVLELKKEEIRPYSTEGYEQGQWVLVDYPGVVLHIFTEEARAHYDLEGFWEKAPRPRVSLSRPKKLKNLKPLKKTTKTPARKRTTTAK